MREVAVWSRWTWGWGCENSNEEIDCWMDHPILQCDQCWGREKCMEQKKIQVVHLFIVTLRWFVCFEYNFLPFLVYIQMTNSLKWGFKLMFDIFNLVFLVNLVFLNNFCNCTPVIVMKQTPGSVVVMVYHIHGNMVKQSSIEPFTIGNSANSQKKNAMWQPSEPSWFTESPAKSLCTYMWRQSIIPAPLLGCSRTKIYPQPIKG